MVAALVTISMKHTDFGKGLFYLLLSVFVAMGVFSAIFLQQTYRELTNLRERQERNARQLELAERELAYKEVYHRNLQDNPEFVERVVRQKLGYARPGELLFRFDSRER